MLAWYGAVRVALASRTLLSHGARAEGEVIGFWKYRSVETGRIPGTDPDIGASDIPMMHGRQRTAETVSPIIRFQPLNGAPVDIVGRGGDGLRSLGAKVTVVYSPAAPDRGRPLTFVDFWIVPLVLFGCGAIAVLAMVVARVAA